MRYHLVFVFLILSRPAFGGPCETGFAFIQIPAKLELLKGSGSEVSASNRFIRAYNSRIITGDDLFVRHNGIPGKIIGATKTGLLIQVIDLSGQVRTITVPLNYKARIKISEHSKELFFRHFLSAVKKVDSPPPYGFSKSQQSLKAKGFSSVFYEGLDKANALLRLGLHLRNSKINPFKTHITPFENQIGPLIAHIRAGIKSSSSAVESRLKILERFEREIRKKAKEKNLTYAGWILFHYRLSYLVTPPAERIAPASQFWMTEEGLTKHLTKNMIREYQQPIEVIYMFPEVIVLPTIRDLGIMALNNTIATGVTVAELPNKKKNTWYPDTYFRHDFNHIIMGYANKNTSLQNLYEKLKRFLKSASVQQRQMAEMVYFLIHENPSSGRFIQNIEFGNNKNKLIKDLKRLHANNKTALYGRRFSSIEEQHRFIERSVNFLARIVTEINSRP